jgi:hypothetical protein
LILCEVATLPDHLIKDLIYSVIRQCRAAGKKAACLLY